MDRLLIHGGWPLKGQIPISGAKNAALPLLCACLLTDETLTLRNVPELADIRTMSKLLQQHGVRVQGAGFRGQEDISLLTPDPRSPAPMILEASNIHNLTAPYELVRTMRASVLVLGPLLARFGAAKVSLPGGCAIGTRPIDLHLSALAAMGAEIDLREGYVHAQVEGRLKGADITFEKVSVGATENILMAAALADGVTTLNNAACEPEVQDLAECLNAMGARIEGIGTARLVITGVDKLHGAEHSVIPDRIEAGSFAAAAAATSGDVELLGVRMEHLGAVVEKFQAAGVDITPTPRGLRVRRAGEALKGIDVMTQAYPGFPTDMQAQMMAMMAIAGGASLVTETIFENRFMHVPELVRMGADITVHGASAMIRGVPELKSAEVMATDLRASISLVIAALAAQGTTTIHRIYHLDRGYEKLEEKLRACGARVERIGGTEVLEIAEEAA